MKTNEIKQNRFQTIFRAPGYILKKRRNKLLERDFDLVQERILTENSPFYVREAYKKLRTNLIFSLPTEGCKKLIITSSLASEGKSTNCLNMAITFAETDAKVLIIDCDLRKPNLARLMNVSKTPGLSNYLVGLNSIDEIIRKSRFDNLSFITAGNIPPNPVELLSSENMKNLIEELENEFDYIFLDTPPINLVIDTVVMSKYVHGIVMIALQNSTDKEAIRYSLNQLEFAGAKILGFVLNGVFLNGKGLSKRRKRKYFQVFKKNEESYEKK